MIAAARKRLRVHAAQNPAYRPVRHIFNKAPSSPLACELLGLSEQALSWAPLLDRLNHSRSGHSLSLKSRVAEVGRELPTINDGELHA